MATYILPELLTAPAEQSTCSYGTHQDDDVQGDGGEEQHLKPGSDGSQQSASDPAIVEAAVQALREATETGTSSLQASRNRGSCDPGSTDDLRFKP